MKIKDVIEPPYSEYLPSVRSISRSVYEEIPSLRVSALCSGFMGRDLFDPMSVKKSFEERTRSTSSMDDGTLAHLMIMEPHLVDERIAIYKGERRQGAAWKEFEAAHSDKIIKKENEFAGISEAVRIVSANKRVRELLSGCSIERAVQWRKHDILMKGRMDADSVCGWPRIVDLKSTSKPLEPHMLESEIRTWRYREKMSLYREGLSLATGIPAEEIACYNVFFRLSPPYGVHVYRLTSDGLDAALVRCDALLDVVRDRIKADDFSPFFAESTYGLDAWEKTDEVICDEN